MDENKKNEKNNNPPKTTNENHIKVSVVIPVYNTETFLNECLDSIISQTLEDIEIICVDDGSTDNSLEILKAYESLDNRIKVYTIPNSGAGAARNFGMKKAKGEYLSFLDSDDYFEPDMLKKAYEAAKRENVDITIVRCDEYIQSKGIYKENNWSIMPWMLPHNPFCASDIPNKIFNIGCGWAWDKLFRRDFVLKSKVSFQEQRTTNDLFFVYSLYTKANSIYVIDEVLAHQRTNLKESLSVTREKSWDNFYKALIAIKEGLIHDGTYDIYKQSFVNWSLNFSLWNIHTLDTKISQKLRKKCRTKYFKDLDISDNTKDYFYNEKEYERMMDIMEGNVKVSIIVPVYNAKEYISTCIDSLISQTFTNIEIICIDDGSDDGSADILKGYQDIEYRLRVFTIEHTNAGAARNIGLEKAVGEYIAFVDVDDFVQPDWLELVLKNADDSDADIIWFRCNLFDHKTNEYIDCPWTLKTHEMPEHRPFSPAEAPEKIFNMGSCKPWDKLYKRQFLEDNKIRFQSISTSNDLLFTFAALAMSGSITTMDDVLYHQRVNHPRVLGQDIEYLTSNYYKSLMALKNYLIENDIYKECKKSYINWALDFSLWSLHSFASPFDDLIRQQLKIKFFEDMDIYGTPQEDFYNHEHYNEMMMIMSERTELEPKPLPKVSIIIPIYNVAHYLPLALDSAIYQTINDIEIICVNDGSTDNSLEIINEYAAKDPRIVVLTGENRGYGHAMNQGLDAAKGEYIGIIEPDDFVDVNMYEKLYETAKDHNLDIVKGDFYRFTHDDYGYFVLNRNSASKTDDDYNVDLIPVYDTRIFNYVMNTWSGIYRRSLIEENNIRHNESPGASFQDNGFWFQTMISASNIRFLKQPYYYNRRDNPNSSVADTEKVYAMNNEYDFIYKILEKDSDKYNRLIGTYHLKRFHNYIFTYNRIDESFRHDYIRKISEEFKNATEKGEIDEFLFSETEFKTLKWIMDDPDDFYDKHNESNPIKVSVIMPVYNTAQFLPEALDTILNQTLEDIELICIDDGSDDDSWEILNAYNECDNRVKIIKQEHAGAGAARNKGIDIATGDFLSFLDSDDFFDNTLLEKTFNRCVRTGADICVYKVRRYDMNTGQYAIDKASFLEKNIPQTEVFNVDDMPNRILNTFQTWTWNKLFRTSFIKDNKLRFQELLRTNDMYFVNTALLKAKRITVLREELVNYREGTSISSQATNNIAPTDFFKALCKLHEEIKSLRSRALQRSFDNLFVRSCIYNLNSLFNTDANSYAYLYRFLHDEGFKRINPREIDKATITQDNKNNYNECVDISRKTFEEYMVERLNYNRRKVRQLESE